jgi:hypothetical protein
VTFQTFPPSAKFAAHAHVDAAKYDQMYAASILQFSHPQSHVNPPRSEWPLWPVPELCEVSKLQRKEVAEPAGYNKGKRF